MCGIAGIFNLSGSELLKEDALRLTRALQHRGPDDEGFLLFSKDSLTPVGSDETSSEIWTSSFPFTPKDSIHKHENPFSGAFGFRRLSILDLSAAGHQPMCNNESNLWIVFNGEIYNYLELRKELISLGYIFKSNTDTEVLLTAYEAWGEKALDKLNGMWSFVIYDKKKNHLFCCRDRFGVKPFYYFSDKDHFAFASEQKALLQLPFIKKDINPSAVFDLFALGKYEAEEEGLLKNILELEPGSFLRLDLSSKKLEKRKYFQLEVNTEIKKFNQSEFNIHCEKIGELINDSIKIRLRSDVPIGSCLSGGIDSSAIVCSIQELIKKNNLTQVGLHQKVFTATFANTRYDESHWAKIVADKTNADWFKVEPEPGEFLSEIEKLTYCQDLPMASISTYAQFKVMQLAKESGVKVIMDGQGGDELFAGYPHHSVAFLNELWRNKMYSSFYKEIKTQKAIPIIKKLAREKVFDSIPPGLLPSLYRFYFNEQQYLNPDFYQKYKHRLFKNADAFSGLNQSLEKDMSNSYLKHYLKCEDRSSMHFSLESRTPFADDINLINYLFSIPSVYKIHNGNSKYLLRESLKGLLPEAIRTRKDKKGFSTPNNEWTSTLKDEFRSYFTSDLEEFLDVKKILNNYNSFFDIKNRPENYRIFKFIGFAVWKKVFSL